jgi:hypothetical protein
MYFGIMAVLNRSTAYFKKYYEKDVDFFGNVYYIIDRVGSKHYAGETRNQPSCRHNAFFIKYLKEKKMREIGFN